MTLADLWPAYFAAPAIRLYLLLAALATAAAAVRAPGWLGPVAAAVATTAVYPFAWYVIHRFILHGRWLYRMPWTAQLWKRSHFDHHQDPHRLEVLFGAPATTLPVIAAVSLPLGWLLGGRSGAAAALATGLLTTCVYEFCHCVQHLNYNPKRGLLRTLKQRHLLHHFHDETGNFGIVSFLPDRLFGTCYAEAKSRPRSPHVFDLGYDLAEAQRYPWVMRCTGSPPRSRPPSAREAAAEAGSD
jgi:sterol desaturase/sphingolipid hydroxylase (fatty acid hydroxylase superfamily)